MGRDQGQPEHEDHFRDLQAPEGGQLQIEGLRNSSKKARAEMRAFLLEAVREMSKEAKENLDTAVTVATAAFAAQNAQEEAAATAAAADRAAIGLKIQLEKAKTKRQLAAAV